MTDAPDPISAWQQCDGKLGSRDWTILRDGGVVRTQYLGSLPIPTLIGGPAPPDQLVAMIYEFRIERAQDRRLWIVGRKQGDSEWVMIKPA